MHKEAKEIIDLIFGKIERLVEWEKIIDPIDKLLKSESNINEIQTIINEKSNRAYDKGLKDGKDF